MIRAATAVAALALLWPGALPAAEKPADGLIVSVPSPVTTESTGRLRSLLHGPLKRFEQGEARQGGRFVLICDFNPEGRRSESDDFGACYGLATYLRSLQTDLKGVRTVAFVHGDVRRHSVLPALACGDVVFSEKGRLGQVVAPGKSLPRVEQTAYEEVTRNRYPAALVRKMYDPNVEVVKAGDQFLDAAARPRQGGQPVAGLAPGELAYYNFALAREVGLCQQLPSASLDEVRVAYSLLRTSLKRALDRTVCWRIPLDGPVNGELVEQTKRRVERALRARANVILLELRCAGGSSEKALELGLYFASLNERRPDSPVETIAYVTSKARNLAVFLAFGCNKLVMQREDE